MDIPQQRQRVTVDGLGDIGVGKWKRAKGLYRNKDYTHRIIAENGRKIIDKATYEKLTRKFRANGGIIIRGKEATEHLGTRLHIYLRLMQRLLGKMLLCLT